MTTQPNLFPENAQEIAERIDAEILSLLCGKSGGRLGLTLADDERRVLSAIRYHRGSARAIMIREMQLIFSGPPLSDRRIKKAVRTLRVAFGLPIGSSKRGAEGGYYLMITSDDRAAWRKDVLDQVRAELAVLRAADSHQGALEVVGQLHMEMLAEAK